MRPAKSINYQAFHPRRAFVFAALAFLQLG
jgi:hypothetical protein